MNLTRLCSAGCAYEQISHKVLTHGYLEKHTTLSAPVKRQKKKSICLCQITWLIKADYKTYKLLNTQASKWAHIPQGLGLFTGQVLNEVKIQADLEFVGALPTSASVKEGQVTRTSSWFEFWRHGKCCCELHCIQWLHPETAQGDPPNPNEAGMGPTLQVRKETLVGQAHTMVT